MHLQGKPVCSFDPEGLIFAAGVNSEMIKLYDLRSFDKVRGVCACGGEREDRETDRLGGGGGRD